MIFVKQFVPAIRIIVIVIFLYGGMVWGQEPIPPSIPPELSIERGPAFCYDVRTFELLNCYFTYTLNKGTYDGGHTHDSGRPTGGLRFAGEDNKGTNSLSFYSGGQAVMLEYVAPEVSGGVKLTIDVIPPPEYICVRGCFEERTALIGVEGLEPLTSSPNLITWTSTEQYHKLSDSNYGTPYTINIVGYAANKYAEYYELPPSINLAVVDMSLPWGGLFDISGKWSPPHSLHRDGKSVDFSKYYRDDEGNNIYVGFFDDDGRLIKFTDLIGQDKLDEYFKIKNCTRLEKRIGKIHYQCPE